ncbi:SUMF1/EgtB/PvdO family nonheme iron enzyme [Vibrio mangrovi]|uniref:SUMF1/EgtB/PvdO family nonheme iron enzyme n=1 Tax=Vibrio mangrovi TaxID=474394 RepID=A0ABU4IE91_9VIBR|nr:formylglycine-generating enzyme family protein [Vibrio mangrovi]MDW6004972.1 SUMF1/EgtB/PvdO family nonheme iron enzyme [Vibrio mangrovi]
MRQGTTALLSTLLLGLVSFGIFAEDAVSPEKAAPLVNQIDDALFSKNTELEDARKVLQEQQQTVANQKAELNRLRQRDEKLSASLNQAKSDLEKAYQKMISDPKLDITTYQSTYQNAWSEYKQNQKSQFELNNKLEEQEGLLKDQETTVSLLQKNISNLQQNKLKARATRLREEISREGTEKVSFTNRCNPSMTIADCEQQTIKLALQKAVKQFQTSLLNNVTESALAGKNVSKASLNVHVLQHQVLQSGFSDASRYRTIVEARLEARPVSATACQLLNIDSQYCIIDDQQNIQREVAWFNLKLHSNLYDDQVIVDDVRYGHTPLTLTLPEGEHQIRVEKTGYLPYKTTLNLKSDSQLRAVLQEEHNQLKTGFSFADSLSQDLSGPGLVAITPGKFFIGEHASTQVFLDHAFAISSTPVTVELFRTFVTQTGYRSDAELTKTCVAMINNQMTPQSGHYWRNPGFKQSSQSPVVCVSQNDAKAFTGWLSTQTGFKYRLPTEDEWEIAARAGTHTDYWWGDDFATGLANTGWGGSYWSNKSTSPVKSFPTNPLGLYDVIGNVWEWTSAPQGLLKGGAWSFSPRNAVVYSQLFAEPSTAANYIGFRVVREIKE